MIASTEEYEGPVKVTVTRMDTGAVLNEKIVNDDYMLICNGNRYVKSYQMWGKTHQLNIAYAPPSERE